MENEMIDGEISPDEYRLGEVIPDSWLDDDGVRHAVIWDSGETTRYKLKDNKVLLEVGVF